MEIQTSYRFYPYLSFDDQAPAGQNQANEIGKIESPEYKIIQNKALQLLGNPKVSASQKAKILNLLALGGTAASSGATGELSNLFRAMERLDPGSAINGNSSPKETPNPQFSPNKQDERSVTYKDGSGDAGVSFKYPVAVNEYAAPLAVSAHEAGHVIAAQARATLNNESVTSYVSIHTGYDSRGRLYTTGGTTTTIYRQKPKREPMGIRSKVNTHV